MAIPSSISIPNLYVKDPFSSALQQGLGSFQKSMQMKQQQDQFNKQQGLREQLAQMQMEQAQAQQAQAAKMDPIALEQAKANLALTQAKTEGMPGQQMQAQQKAQMDMIYKQRTQDNKLIELATNNPDILNNPQVMAQFNAATQRVSQDLPIPGQMQQSQGGMQQQGLQGSLQSMKGTQPGAIQSQQRVHPQQDVAEQMQFRQEQKLIPSDLKNQMVRSGSAALMIEDLRGTLNQLKPFFGVSGGIKGAIKSYAAETGMSDDESARLFNTLDKKIKAMAGEVASGMTKSRAESTIKEWQDIVDPRTNKFVGFNQVMDNLNAVEKLHDINSQSLFENYPVSKGHHDKWLASRKQSIKDKYVPRETKSNQQYSQQDIISEMKRRGLL